MHCEVTTTADAIRTWLACPASLLHSQVLSISDVTIQADRRSNQNQIVVIVHSQMALHDNIKRWHCVQTDSNLTTVLFKDIIRRPNGNIAITKFKTLQFYYVKYTMLDTYFGNS